MFPYPEDNMNDKAFNKLLSVSLVLSAAASISFIVIDSKIRDYCHKEVAPIYIDVNHDGITDKIVTIKHIDNHGLLPRCVEEKDTMYGFERDNKKIFISQQEFQKYIK